MNEEEYIKKVGQNIINRRNELGIRQVELAHLLGIEDSSLRRIEKGKTNPTFKTLYKIAEILKFDLIDLLKVDNIKE